LGTDFNISFVTVPLEALVIPDCGGDRDIYFVVLTKHSWSQFFGERIIIVTNSRYWTCVRENINIRGHQNDRLDHYQEQKYTGTTNSTMNLIILKQFFVSQKPETLSKIC
jgi:hypothetical protein